MRNGLQATQPSRRRLLRFAGGAGLAAAAATATQLARPGAAQAADGDSMILGSANSATSTTSVGTASSNAFAGTSVQATGVQGTSEFGTGVVGQSGSGWGVSAQSNTGTALQAQSKGGVGVVGVGNAGTGVYGQSGTTNGYAVTRDGVRGFSDSDAAAGVRGENAGTGYGVSGVSSFGVGVLAKSTAGTALRVSGPASFSRAGLATIGAASTSATVKVPGGLSAGSMVLALLQTAVSGIWVASAVPDAATGKATISLNKAPTVAVKVAWFVVG